MPPKSECLQCSLGIKTPCFISLGSKPCEEQQCLAASYLAQRNIDPFNPNGFDTVVVWSLHWICPKSIHNEELDSDTKKKLFSGLAEQCKQRASYKT